MAHRTHRIALTFALLIGFALLGNSAAAQAQDPSVPAQNPLSRIAWLVGHWKTVELATGGSPETLILEGRWAPDMNSILITCNHIAEDQKSTPYYQGTYTWDPQNKKIVVKQMYANGDHFEGEARPIATDFAQVGKMIRADGSMQDVQSRYVAWSPDTFSIEVTTPGQPLNSVGTGLDLVYLRQKDSSAPGTTNALQK